jgi:hypothetical protein
MAANLRVPMNWEVELWGLEPQTSCMPFRSKIPLYP